MAVKTQAGFAPGVGGTLFAGSDGKGSRQQSLGGLNSGMKSAITPGDPLSRMVGQYGKGHSYLPAGSGGPISVDPTQHPGVSQVRGGKGGMRSHIRQGGLGPGKDSAPGDSSDYSMNNQDPE